MVPHKNIKWIFHCYVLITLHKTVQDNNTHNTYLSIMSLRSLVAVSVLSIKQPRFVRLNTLPFCSVYMSMWKQELGLVFVIFLEKKKSYIWKQKMSSDFFFQYLLYIVILFIITCVECLFIDAMLHITNFTILPESVTAHWA